MGRFGQADEDEDETLNGADEGDVQSSDVDEGEGASDDAPDAEVGEDDAASEGDETAAAEPDLPAPAGGEAAPPDKQQEIENYLAKQYGVASDPSAVKSARAQAQADRQRANIGHAVSGLFRAESMAHGGAGPNEAYFKGLRDQAEIPVTEAEQDRQAKIRDFVTQHSMARQQAQDTQHAKDTAVRAAELKRWHDAETARRAEASKETHDYHKGILAQKGAAAAGKADAAGEKVDAKATAEQNKNYKEMFNRGEGGRGAPQSVTKAQVAQSSVKNAQQLLKELPKGPNGEPDFNKMSPQQVHLFNGELEKLATNGSPTEGGRAAQDAGTFAQHWAQFKNKFAGPDGEVAGADLGPFIKQSATYIEGLGKVSDEVVNTYRRSNFDNYAKAGLISDKHQEIYKAQHPELFPEERKADAGAPAPAAPAGNQQSAAPAVAHPQANAALAWAKANPKDPRAAEIMKRLGSNNAGL